MEYLGYLSAIIMGISLGVIGGGGSILTVPILVYFFSQDPVVATTDSLFIVGSTALFGALVSARNRLIDFRTGVLFAIPSFAGVFTARQLLLPKIPNIIFSFQDLTLTKPLLIMGCFALLMITASRSMLRSGNSVPFATDETPAKVSVLAVALKGFLVGLTTGFVGAGGGFLVIPALVVLLKIPMRIAVGTSLAIIAANSLLGFLISQSTDVTDWRLLLTIAGIGIFGILVGQRYASLANEKVLKRSFGYFVLTVGSLVLLDQILKLK